jgi:hypothetical protein
LARKTTTWLINKQEKKRKEKRRNCVYAPAVPMPGHGVNHTFIFNYTKQGRRQLGASRGHGPPMNQKISKPHASYMKIIHVAMLYSFIRPFILS